MQQDISRKFLYIKGDIAILQKIERSRVDAIDERIFGILAA
jgi:hypothetical protein